MNPPSPLGIDIAKDTFQVALLHLGQTHQGQFANQPAGFKKLAAWLKKRQVPQVWACLEATGRYGEPLAEYLHAHGHPVSVVNPLVTKAYAQSQLSRNKTDTVDARLLLDFCASQRPPRWSPPAPEIRELRELLHHRDTLVAHRQQLSNRLGAGLRSATVRAQLQAQLAFVDEQLAQLQQQVDDHIDRHPDLKQRQALLESIPGIGALTAAKLQAVDLERFDQASQVSAFAGVAPMNRTSGTSVRRRPKLSKVGSASLRQALYMPALVATKHNPIVAALYQRLLERGLAKPAAVGAAMHKLLRLAFGVVKSGQPFDPCFGQNATVAA